MNADLIRWHGPQAGGHYSGHAGSQDAMLFNIWSPAGLPGDEEWVLTSSLPGQRPGEALSYGPSPEPLKARAEELLREFAASIGAVFPADLGEQFWRDSERRKIQAVATANARDDCIALLRDKADEVGREPDLLRARMYRDAADLIRGDDQ